MSEIQIHPSYAKFGVAFLRSIASWNNAENAARDILNSLSSGGIGATIAIHQLGNASLVDALKTVCQFLENIKRPISSERASHIFHFIEGLDRLRVYRNHYVHQIRSVTITEDDTFEGSLWGLDVKNGYSFISDKLSLTDLETFTSHCIELQQYGEGISKTLQGTQGGLGSITASLAPPLSSLQKPIWPERLKKSRHNLLARSPQPESSQE